MVRSEPEINLMMGGHKETIAEGLVTAKATDNAGTGVFAIVNLNPIESAFIGRLQMKATE